MQKNAKKREENGSKKTLKISSKESLEIIGEIVVVIVIAGARDAVNAGAGSRRYPWDRAGPVSHEGHAGYQRAQLLRGKESFYQMVTGPDVDLIVDD